MEVGTLVGGRYRVEALAASGGMGRVYRARDERSGARTALKILDGGGQLTAERFRREVDLLSQLEHPAIVRYLDHGAVDADAYFLAMEWLDGEDLARRLARGALDLEETVALATRVAEALAFAHARGVVHRDVKPANLFVGDGGVESVKVVDFGVARPIGLRQRRATRAVGGELSVTGVGIGTVGYMAPEQARGERYLDARADVFALGCVIFECLAGRPPFVADDPVAVLAKILVEEPPRLSDVAGPRVPAWLDELVRRMLDRDPAARPADGAALVRELEAHRLDAPAGGASAAGRGAPAITGGERRLTCILAIRPAAPGSAATEASIDLPRLQALAATAQARLEPIVDGSFVAVLTASGIAGDLAAQAARCALVLRGAAGVAAVALATGFRVVGAAPATGSVVERAFRQLDDAPPHPAGAVRIDELTAGLIDGPFEIAREGGRLWLLRACPTLEGGRTLLGRLTPFVGRDKELGLLLASLEETLAEPIANAVLVVAPAGVGKSRLRHELVRAARERHPELQVWVARADAARRASPLALLADILAGVAGLRDDDPAALRRHKLQLVLGRRLRGEALGRVAEFLGEIAGAPPEEPSLLLQGARDDPRRMWEETRRAWEDWLDAELAGAPLLVVLDDVQWGDARTARLLEETFARRARPLMLLATGRPEALDQFGPAWEERGLQIVRLQRLGRRASEALVRQVLGPDAGDARVAAIVERADGHALFLEELLRAEVEGRGGDTPATVIAMLQERIERFETDARRLLRAASIFGLEFSRGGVAALVDEPGDGRRIAAWLDTLLGREVIVVAETRRFAHEESYAFRHDLVREAVYATLTDDDRRRGHRLAARWLEAAGERDAATLAEHFARGGDLDNAARCFAQAAEQAYEREDFDEAVRHVECSVTCGAAGEVLGRLRRLQATIALARNTLADTERFAGEALELLEPGSPAWYHSATVMVTIASFGVQGRVGEVVARVRAAADRADERIGMAGIRAWALCANMLYFSGQYALAADFDARIAAAAERAIANEPCAAAWVHFARHVHASYCGGDPETTVREATRAGDILEQTGNREALVWLRIEEAKAAGLLGDFEGAERLLESALRATAGLLFPRALAQHRLARLRAWQGDTAVAISLQREANEMFREQGLPVFHAVGDNQLALFLFERGEREAAAQVVAAALDGLWAAPPVRVYALSTQARLALAGGDGAAALGHMREAAELRRHTGLINDGESPFDLALVEALQATGAADEARAAARAACERLHARAAAVPRAEDRRRFLDRVPENARLLALADALGVGAK